MTKKNTTKKNIYKKNKKRIQTGGENAVFHYDNIGEYEMHVIMPASALISNANNVFLKPMFYVKLKDAELQKLSIKLKGRYINVFIIMKKINSRGGFKWYGSTNHTVLDKWSDCFIELGAEFNRYNKNDIQYTGTYTNEGDVIIVDYVLHKPLDENSSEINALKKWYTIENVKVGSKFAAADIASDWALNSCSIM